MKRRLGKSLKALLAENAIGNELYWSRVESAMERGKRGEPAAGDHEICVEAWRRWPARYAQTKRAVDARVVAEERKRFTR